VLIESFAMEKPLSFENFDEYTWEVVDKFFKYNKGYQLVKHQIESYNDFILRKLPQILDGFNPIEIPYMYDAELEKFKYILIIEVTNPVLGKPLIYEKDGSTKIMTPNDARLRNFTYSAQLTTDVDITAKTLVTEGDNVGSYVVEVKKITGVTLGKIPIMARSNYCVLKNVQIGQETGNECRYDLGGYFIVNGNEKVVISQGRMSENKTNVFVNNKVSTYSHVAEIRSVQENKLGVPKITSLKLSAKGNQFGRYIRANIHHIKNDVPVFILFKALGLTSDKEILSYIVYDLEDPVGKLIANELIGCIEEANNIHCPKDALEFLSKYLNITGYPKEIITNKHHRINIVRMVLENEFLPHVGKGFHKKALYLGYMVNKLIRCFLGLKEFDDRDSYINKKVDTPGVLMANLFRQYYGKVIKDMKNMIQKEFTNGGWRATSKFLHVITKVNVTKIIKSTIIDSGMRYALATGNWGPKSNKNKQGVAQVLNRLTFYSALSHIRRVSTPIEKSGKLVQPRKLHSTQFGIICPAETPEGASVGLVQNLAVSASITIASNSTNVREIVNNMGVILFDGSNIDIFGLQNTRVVINGDIIGIHERPQEIYKELIKMKRNGGINPYTSVVWHVHENELRICTEGGRCVRPLYAVYQDDVRGKHTMDVNVNMDWNDIMRNGVVEYIDVEEINSLVIAMTKNDLLKGTKGNTLPVKYTHLEIHPSLILGAIASCIPFADHNQAPRVAYQSSMAKQALGVYATNYRHRFDTMGHVLDYPQKPLVRTKVSQYVNKDDLPCGINAIVAIATYTGSNQEDSVLLNKSSIDMGLFCSTYYRTYKEQNNKNYSNGEEEFFTKPDETSRATKPYNYGKITPDGFVPENTFVKNGDVIIGKCMPCKNGSTITYKDNSISLKTNEKCFVDKNCYNDRYFTNINGDGNTFCKVRTRSSRIPTVGDKFASRSAQKGTCGILYNREDMPFTKDGIVPDIIMNPHAIPSRMTMAQLMECIMGKACVGMGSYGDSTPFTDLSVEHIAGVLEAHGMERYGNEIMYNSRTGEQIATEIFIGPTYYQRLKHMTIDKEHSRSQNGPIVLLTRQPAEGRARDGGLRFGEMETECACAHGAQQFLKERFMDCSDNYVIFTCKECGLMANVNTEKNIYYCKACKNNTNIAEIRIPYAAKLLFHEVQTMGIGARFLTGAQ
jgi:DNA-directed RNA polymerase II subunit RPB2